MKHTVVKYSELEDRLDPRFYIARAEVKERLAEIKAAYQGPDGIAEIKRILSAIEVADKIPMLVLSRRSDPRLDAATIDSIEKEYPHFALALMEQGLAPAIERIRACIAKNTKYLEALLDIAKDLEHGN